MIFKANRQSFSVYDPKVDKCIAELVDYKFETQDQAVINRLIELGYEPVDVVYKAIAEIETTVLPIVSETGDEIKPKRGRPRVIK